jgi:hypothetical protein
MERAISAPSERLCRPGARIVDLIAQRVHFKVRDVQFPEVADLLWELYGNESLEGKVIELTSGGDDAQPFAVIQLDGDRPSVIVAVSNLLP